MANPAIRKISYPFNTLWYWIGVVQFVIAVPGLYFALIADPVKSQEVLILGIIAVGSAVAAFGRVGLIVDNRAGTLTKWWGLGIPLSRSVLPLGAITHVRLLKQIVNTSKGQRVFFPVMLTGRNIAEQRLWETVSYASARRRAEALARLLRIDLHDETSGDPVIRQWRYLDEPLVERYHRLGLPAPFPQPPPGTFARIHDGGTGGKLAIEIPASGFRMAQLPLMLVVLSLPLATVLLAAVMEMLRPGESPGLTIFFAVLFSPMVPVALLILVNQATVRELITVSPAGIEIEARSRVRRKCTRIAAAEIEEIVTAADVRKSAISSTPASLAIGHFAGVRAVLIRTDKGSTGVGPWVSEAEQIWLRDMLVHGLVGGPLGLAAPYSAPAAALPTGSAEQPGSSWKWLAWMLAAGVLVVIGQQSGVLQKTLDLARTVGQKKSAQSLSPIAGYDLTPGPGSAYIQIYARGVRVGVSGPNLCIAIDEVRLMATSDRDSTTFRDLSLSVHRRVGQEWKLVGATTRGEVRASLDAAGSYTYPGVQEFVIKGAAEVCAREPCHFRVHVLGQVGSRRPGWDVTEFAPLALQ